MSECTSEFGMGFLAGIFYVICASACVTLFLAKTSSKDGVSGVGDGVLSDDPRYAQEARSVPPVSSVQVRRSTSLRTARRANAERPSRSPARTSEEDFPSVAGCLHTPARAEQVRARDSYQTPNSRGTPTIVKDAGPSS